MERKIKHINEPYYTAGKKYHWPGPPIGFGINTKDLLGEGNMYVTVGESEKVWVATKATLRKFIMDYNTYSNIRSVRLGIVAWSLFVAEEAFNKTQNKLL